MKLATALMVILVTFMAAPASGLDAERFQMRDDFDTGPLYDCALQYYYYIPCPTYSWFWVYTGWDPGAILGEWFQVGDLATGGWATCSPTNCHVLETIRFLDFAGYGSVHPGLFTVEFDVYCSDEYGCPIGPSLWNSGPYETHFAWNYVDVDPPVTICGCAVDPGPPPSGPRILVTVTHTGPEGIYPAWGFDNISTPLDFGCSMHDYGCLPALYPRPYFSHYTTIHSGFYGQNMEYCPPRWFNEPGDTTPDGTQLGFLELAWRLYLVCSGPTDAQPATWSSIKSMYR
jgi:hypothetical protein